ncbi:unnamed protein product [Tilletia laevis]|nr:unnamed protein product [Tilletia laevis]CAD6975565.1 unnamed protein product [Tilletia controversa]
MIFASLLVIASTLASSAVLAAPTPDPLLSIGIGNGLDLDINIGGGGSSKQQFTSAFSVRATPETVIATDGTSAPGQTGALGHYAFRINSETEVICYDIRLVGVSGAYSSKALTATHIHQAAAGASGPPRIAFPNPAFVRKNHLGQEVRESKGCLQGPFRTGANTTAGIDTGSASGFTLKQIEDNPSSFFADTHTEAFIAGAVRGQLLRSELEVAAPKKFDAILTANAQPGNVVNSSNVAVPGQKGASGSYKFKINLKENTLCYTIEAKGLEGEYFSPAKTATHVHFAARGVSGPPRLSFRNPQPVKSLLNNKVRRSSACIKGPFTTGLTNAATGLDTSSASGFTLQQLIDTPEAFFADTHTEQFAAGAFRGQLVRVE